MALKVEKLAIPDVLLITPDVYPDPRGFFLESYSTEKYRGAGIPVTFVQDNHSHSSRGTLRGLHYQLPHAQAKLLYVLRGEILDVAVDIRRGSPTFGKWVSAVLSDKTSATALRARGSYGFCVTSEIVDVVYKCTDYHSPKDDHGVLWSDPALGSRGRCRRRCFRRKTRSFTPVRHPRSPPAVHTAINANGRE